MIFLLVFIASMSIANLLVLMRIAQRLNRLYNNFIELQKYY